MNCSSSLGFTLKNELTPDGIWTLPKHIESLLANLLNRLPRGVVSKQERRSPSTAKEIRSFIDALFARHYFQIQSCLLPYISGLALESIVKKQTLCIADIGSGPAIASLAIIDMLNLALTHLSINKKIRIKVVLNDTSDVCLNIGKAILDEYSKNNMAKLNVEIEHVIPISTPLPKSLIQLRRIANTTGTYDLCCLSYLLAVLEEQVESNNISHGIKQLAETLNPNHGQILLVQDKFHKKTFRRICRQLEVPSEQVTIKQRIYDSANEYPEYSYTFHRAFYPLQKATPALKPSPCNVHVQRQIIKQPVS